MTSTHEPGSPAPESSPDPVGDPASAESTRSEFSSESTGSESSTDSTAESTSRSDHSRRGFGQLAWAAVREVLIVVGLAMALSLLVKTFLVQPFHIPSGSMENTLIKGDRVVVSKLTPGPVDLERGDIVVFTDPDSWLGELPPVDPSALNRVLIFLGLAPDESSDHLIKRVIGLPGDRVVCCTSGGELTVNGLPITEPYLKPGDTPGGDRSGFDIVVPQGRLWVMGDHRSDSADSRFHDDGTGATGSVPIDLVIGRAVVVVWPLDRVTWLSVSERVFANVPGSAGTPTATNSSTAPTGSGSASRRPGSTQGVAPASAGANSP